MIEKGGKGDETHEGKMRCERRGTICRHKGLVTADRKKRRDAL